MPEKEDRKKRFFSEGDEFEITHRPKFDRDLYFGKAAEEEDEGEDMAPLADMEPKKK